MSITGVETEKCRYCTRTGCKESCIVGVEWPKSYKSPFVAKLNNKSIKEFKDKTCWCYNWKSGDNRKGVGYCNDSDVVFCSLKHFRIFHRKDWRIADHQFFLFREAVEIIEEPILIDHDLPGMDKLRFVKKHLAESVCGVFDSYNILQLPSLKILQNFKRVNRNQITCHMLNERKL